MPCTCACVCVCVCACVQMCLSVRKCVCVCVLVFGFYNFHLPKHSKFFQSVYYIYYLSHAVLTLSFARSGGNPTSISFYPTHSLIYMHIVLAIRFVSLCLTAAILALPSCSLPLAIRPSLTCYLCAPPPQTSPFPAPLNSSSGSSFICIFWLLCGKNITYCAAASKQTAPPQPPLSTCHPTQVTPTKTGQR